MKAAEVAADRAAAIEALSAKVEAEKAALAAAKALHVDLEAVTPADEAGALAGLEKRAKEEFGIVVKNTIYCGETSSAKQFERSLRQGLCGTRHQAVIQSFAIVVVI
jgi:hypothetical protein